MTTDESSEVETTENESDGFIDEELIPILIVGGVLLLLFPEPVTSTVGLVLVVVGAALWLYDLLQ